MENTNVAVHTGIELLMTVQAASDWRHQGLCQQPYPYRDAAFALADRFSEHPACQQARALLADGFSYDAPVAFVLCHGAPPSLEQQAPYDPHYVLERAGPGGVGGLVAFAAALRDFVRRTDFAGFLRAWEPFHAQVRAQALSSIDPAWTARLAAYSGMAPASTHICVAPLSRQGFGYGPTIAAPSGPVHVTVAGPAWVDEGMPRFDARDFWKPVVIHEGAHGFVNPTMDAQGDTLAASAASLEPIAATISPAYGVWQAAAAEHVVRAVAARLSDDPDRALAQEEKWGFRYVRAVAAALEEYEAQRDRYPRFADFGPRLAQVFADLCK